MSLVLITCFEARCSRGDNVKLVFLPSLTPLCILRITKKKLISELEALIFLHACYNSMEKAKIAMDTYHTTRTHCPEFFAKRDVNGADVAAQMKVLYV